MNAEAHLRAQGWQGPGNGLRKGALQRAILTSKKIDQKGLGAKQSESDQWWDNIFSKQLSSITVGVNGQVEQINGGVKASHPVAARHAHKRQFGEKSALEKVFKMGEVLKGTETFIPLQLIPQIAAEVSRTEETRFKPDSDEDSSKKSKQRERASKIDLPADEAHITSLSTTLAASQALLTPLVSSKSPAICPLSTKGNKKPNRHSKDMLKVLSDKEIRREAKRVRREARALRRAEKVKRKDARQQKREKKNK